MAQRPTRRTQLDPVRLRRQLERYPALAGCVPRRAQKKALASPVGEVAYLLERLERNDGLDSEGLAFDELIVAQLNRLRAPGWGELKTGFGGGDRATYRSHISEFRLAFALQASGFELVRFGAPTGAGTNMDLLTRSSAGDLLIEVLAPTTISSGADWAVLHTDALCDGLERVGSGLLVRLAGYRRSHLRPPDDHVERTVERFIEAIAERRSLRPGGVLLSRKRGDLVDITILARRQRELAHTTAITFDWSSGDFSPNLSGLAGKLLEKRRQLDPEQPGLIAADLASFDLASTHAATTQIKNAMSEQFGELGIATTPPTDVEPRMPEAFGLFISPSSRAEATTFWRRLIYVRRDWKRTRLGRLTCAYWQQ